MTRDQKKVIKTLQERIDAKKQQLSVLKNEMELTKARFMKCEYQLFFLLKKEGKEVNNA